MLYVKENLQKYFAQNDYWLLPVMKASFAFLCFFTVNLHIHLGSMFANPLFSLVAALLCSFLPTSAIPVFGGLLILGALYKTSMELLVSSAILFLLFALMQNVFKARYAILIAAMPLAFYLHLPFLIPIIAGLSLGLASIVPVAIGTVVYYYLTYLAQASPSVSTKDIAEMANAYADFFTKFFSDRTMVAFAVALTAAVLIVFIIRSIGFDYDWIAALLAGVLTEFIALFVSAKILNVSVSWGNEILSGVLALILGFIYVILFHAANYEATERLQFEDDDYYYYVKAVPKFKADQPS